MEGVANVDGRDGMERGRDGRTDGRDGRTEASGTVARTRSAAAAREARRVATALGGLCLTFAVGTLVAQDDVCSDTSTDTVMDESAPAPAPVPVSESAPADEPRGGMIPRDALVDMSRAQSRLLCSSEVFLGCMGFDGSMCLSLSEAAIEQCLMSLPAEIDPATLDNDSLEACPGELYAKAGYDERKAATCLEKALEES